MSQHDSKIWYLETENKSNPLQLSSFGKVDMPRMYIRKMTQSEREDFPLKGLGTLYSIRDELGNELGATDDYDGALQLAQQFGARLHSVH